MIKWREQNMADELLLGKDEAAAFLGVSVRTLEAWRYKGTGPVSWRSASGRVVYPYSGLVKFLDTRAEESKK